MTSNSNPFSLTKANDLTNDQIQDLWVDVGSSETPNSLFNSGRFASPMPTFILGGKGSGKTHLMRYASYELQRLRTEQKGDRISAGLRNDGYIGIYMRCSGIENGRFSGKGQSEEAWLEIFSYYLELTLSLAVLRIVADVTARDKLNYDAKLCDGIRSLFDDTPPTSASIAELIADLDGRRRALDYEVNNSAFTGQLNPQISVSRGRLIFGLPKLLSEIPVFEGLLFSYQLDEFENLTFDQQRHINTLVRERESPATLKIGARQFGVRTHRTLSADEENIRDSEFDEIRLDQRFRQNESQYKDLVDRLVGRRLEAFWPKARTGRTAANRKLSDWFDEPNMSWDAEQFQQMVKGLPSYNRPHLLRLRELLLECAKGGDVPGISTVSDCETVLDHIHVSEYPLLEKLNTVLIFNAWANSRDLKLESANIHRECSAFVSGERGQKYKQKLDHYKTDLIAQMIRSSGGRQTYAGFSTFTRMSEGQPRALITLLKQTFDWASFQGERPFESGRITIEAQSKGALAASDWFYNSMRTSGEEGRSILTAITRLAELFRINRYADNPIECSLIGFSASLHEVSTVAEQTLQLAVDRSLLVEVLGGQQDRNSEQVTHKFQLNRMLVPRYGLPTGRRGIKPLSTEEMDAIFDPSKGDEFAAVVADWTARMTAPFSRQGRAAKASPASSRQSDLFS